MIQLRKDESMKVCSQYQTNDWILSYKWDQALWDAAQVLDQTVLGVRQITCSTSHPHKFAHLKPLNDAAQPTRVEFLTICRQKNFESFKEINVGLPPDINVTQETVWYEELISEDEEPALKTRRTD